MGTLGARLTRLERKFATVLQHEVYFRILEMWFETQFGVSIFPKGKKDTPRMEVNGGKENDEENPFLPIVELEQRIDDLEDKVDQLFGENPPSLHSENSISQQKQSLLMSKVGRPRLGVGGRGRGRGRGKVALPTRTSAMARVLSNFPSRDARAKVTRSSAAAGIAAAAAKVKNTKIGEAENSETEPCTVQLEKLDEEGLEKAAEEARTKTNDDEVGDEGELTIDESYLDDKDEYDESEDIKPDVDEINRKRNRDDDGDWEPGFKKRRKTSEDTQAEDGTRTRTGRRHTVPRRYAEFTAHSNINFKKQKLGTTSPSGHYAATTGPSPKKKPGGKPRGGKMKSVKEVKIIKTKAMPMEVEDIEVVENLVKRLEEREMDVEGNVVLSDRHPSVKVNLQQLLGVVVRAGGKSTRLARKLTTLIFEDEVLANASPFGTKYYKERLPFEQLEALVDFIVESGFEPFHSPKKICMLVAQVCNEARAGRVRKLPPAAPVPTIEGIVSTVAPARKEKSTVAKETIKMENTEVDGDNVNDCNLITPDPLPGTSTETDGETGGQDAYEIQNSGSDQPIGNEANFINQTETDQIENVIIANPEGNSLE